LQVTFEREAQLLLDRMAAASAAMFRLLEPYKMSIEEDDAGVEE
jgi:hypothetical protein